MAKIKIEDGVIHYTEGKYEDMSIPMNAVVVDKVTREPLFMYSYPLEQLYRTGELSFEELRAIREQIELFCRPFDLFLGQQLGYQRREIESKTSIETDISVDTSGNGAKKVIPEYFDKSQLHYIVQKSESEWFLVNALTHQVCGDMDMLEYDQLCILNELQ